MSTISFKRVFVLAIGHKDTRFEYSTPSLYYVTVVTVRFLNIFYFRTYLTIMLSSYFPILEWFPKYKKEAFYSDLFAGITVAIILIPQGIAYAMIAGLPIIYGLYASLVPLIIYGIMGTSRQLSVGPVAIDSLLVASSLSTVAISGTENYIALAIFLAFLVGCIQLLLGVFKMGFLVNFLSKPVINGFTSAVAIIIGLNQIKHLTGINAPNESKLHLLVEHLLNTVSESNLYTLLIGTTTILLLKLLKYIHPKIPFELVAILFSTLIVYLFKLSEMNVSIIGKLPIGLPFFSTSHIQFDKFSQLFPTAITVALIGFTEAISIGKSIEEKKATDTIIPNQELIALGTSNIISSFFQAYPTTGGFSRTAVNEQAGAKSGIASLISASFIGLALLFLTSLFYFIPKATLAGIIIVSVLNLVDLNYPLQLLKKNKTEFSVLVITFIVTLFIGVQQGVLIGILVSIVFVLYRTSNPHFVILGKIKNTSYFKNINRFDGDIEIHPNILILRFDAQLYFGNKDYFKRQLLLNLKNKKHGTKTIILNAEAINYIDSSASTMLNQLIKKLHAEKIEFLIAGAIGPTRDILFSSDLIDVVGKKNLFVRTHEAYNYSTKKLKKTPLQEKISWQSKNI